MFETECISSFCNQGIPLGVNDTFGKVYKIQSLLILHFECLWNDVRYGKAPTSQSYYVLDFDSGSFSPYLADL